MYIDRPLKEYLEDLAARKPAPGGGSAAALSAAIGVGLLSMVANYTEGNPKYKLAGEKMADLLVRFDNYRSELEGLVDEDVEVYEKLSAGIKKSGKDAKGLEELYREAVRPPFEVCKISAECLKLCKDMAQSGNKNLITDTAIAAIILEGAFFSAKFNVYLNLKYIRDTDYVGQIHGVLAPLEKELPKLKEEILELCEEVIR